MLDPLLRWPGVHRRQLTLCLCLGLWVGGLRSGWTQQGSGAVIGQVISRQTRAPVSGALVFFLGSASPATSDTSGRFQHTGLTPGVHVLQVRAPGYATASWPVELAEGEVVEHLFEMDVEEGYELPPVVVEGKPTESMSRFEGFERRRVRGVGHFITREEIERRQAATLSDLLRNVPGVNTACSVAGCEVRMARSPRRCRPEYYLDGFPASLATGPNFPARGIKAVEIYNSPVETPPEFQRPNLVCGIVAIWTKSGP